MKFNLTLEIKDMKELRDVIEKLGGKAPVVSIVEEVEKHVAEDAVDVKPKRTRRTKAEIEAEKAAKETTKAEKETAKEEKVKAPKADDVRAALQALVKAKGMDIGREALKNFGAIKIGDLKEEDYANFIKACNEGVSS